MRRWARAWALIGLAGCGADPPRLPTSTSTSTVDGSGTTRGGGETQTSSSGATETTAADETGSTSDATTSSATATTTGPANADCPACAVANCATELASCEDTTVCSCWVSCVGDGGTERECDAGCGEVPPLVSRCTALWCHDDCFPGSPTIYEPCDYDTTLCPPGLYCANAPRHCTFECVDTAECPAAPAGVTSVPLCDELAGGCILDCSVEGATCPPGLGCSVFGIDLCAQ